MGEGEREREKAGGDGGASWHYGRRSLSFEGPG